MVFDDFLKRVDFVGGDVESHENNDVYRGPISKIEVVDRTLVITSPWVAIMAEKGWKKYRGEDKITINLDLVEPQCVGECRVIFNMPLIGLTVLFPKGGSKLDPGKVFGLETGDLSNND